MKLAKLYKDAKLPTRKHQEDAGLDLYLYSPHNQVITLYPNTIYILNTGITVEIPKYHFGFIGDKSSSDFIIIGRIVDRGYQGEILVKVINCTDKPIVLHHEKAIAQLLILPILIPGITEVELSEIHQEKSERENTGGIAKQSDAEKSLTHDRPEPKTAPPLQLSECPNESGIDVSPSGRLIHYPKIRFIKSTFGNDSGDTTKIVGEDDQFIYYMDGFGRYCCLDKEKDKDCFEYILGKVK